MVVRVYGLLTAHLSAKHFDSPVGDYLLPMHQPISLAHLGVPVCTSFAFMLVWVPEPVCQTTRGKCSVSLPLMTCKRRSVASALAHATTNAILRS